MINVCSMGARKDVPMAKYEKFVPFEERTGLLPHTLLNDYLFKIVFQSDDDDYIMIKSLLSALLGTEIEDITDIVIENTIVPGTVIDGKSIVLDIYLTLNRAEKVNIELQVVDMGDWEQRSIFYTCKMYTKGLKKGKDYITIKPAHHIGILDFDPDNVTPKLYSKYHLSDVETGEVYSRYLTLSVLNLNRIDTASDEDKRRKLNIWAKVFKATTWDELKAAAKDIDVISKVSEKVYEMTRDEEIEEALERWEADKAWEARTREEIEEAKEEIKRINKKNEELEKENEELKKELEKLKKL